MKITKPNPMLSKVYLNTLEVFYNRQRRHSYLGYVSPEYERRFACH